MKWPSLKVKIRVKYLLSSKKKRFVGLIPPEKLAHLKCSKKMTTNSNFQIHLKDKFFIQVQFPLLTRPNGVVLGIAPAGKCFIHV